MRVGIDGRHIQDHFPGIARYTYNLVEHLAPLVDGELVVLHNPMLPNTRFDIAALGRHPRLRLHPTSVPTFSWREQTALRHILDRQRLGVFHTPYFVMPYLPPCPTVLTVHDVLPALFPQYLPSRWAGLAFRLAMYLATRAARHIIAVSECTKMDLRRQFGVPSSKVTVVYSGVDARFRPRPKESLAVLRAKYHLPERFVLYVGVNKPHKNLPRLIEAFSMVWGELDCPLVIAGRRDDRWPQDREAVELLALTDWVCFLGDVPEAYLPGIYNLASLFVMPSTYEGFGLPVLEAMASGVPVVCSSAASLPEVAGDAALLVDPYSVSEIADAMRTVLADPLLAADLAKRGLERAAKFTWAETAQKTLEVYRRCLA